MKEVIRRLAARTLDIRGVQRLLRRLNRDQGIIFMLHRTREPEAGWAEPTADTVREFLSFLRRHGFLIVRVSELLRRIQAPGEGTGPYVAFTLDDGYRDQARIAAPVFAEFEAPATIFPVAGFLDGSFWMWWDRLDYMVAGTREERVRLELPPAHPGVVELDLTTPDSRGRSLNRIAALLKEMAATQRDQVLERLAQRCGVGLPSSPPEEYAPMTWDDARACEALGVTIGPHTMTHSILARETDETVRHEMEGSWRRVQEEVSDPEPVFCYPNGKAADFGRRELELARELGLEGAVSAQPGYVKPSAFVQSALGVYALPRFCLPWQRPIFIQIVSGLASDGPGLAVGKERLTPPVAG